MQQRLNEIENIASYQTRQIFVNAPGMTARRNDLCGIDIHYGATRYLVIAYRHVNGLHGLWHHLMIELDRPLRDLK